MLIRRQASLYLTDVRHIELLRMRFNPAQARLIPAHVTLCREDEVADWDSFRARLESLRPFELRLTFGKPCRDGNFVYLPVEQGVQEFHNLRCALLTPEPRQHTPHLTIIHPRNGVCTDQDFAEISQAIPSFQHCFQEVMLIWQEGGSVWELLAKVES
jgi:hypothetical protein